MKKMTLSLALLFTVAVFASGEKPQSASEVGLMKGFPPSQDRQVKLDNWFNAPYNRWSYQHLMFSVTKSFTGTMMLILKEY